VERKKDDVVVSLGLTRKFKLKVVDKDKKNMSKWVAIRWEKGEGGVDTKRKICDVGCIVDKNWIPGGN
jgi:hypothetical protein